MTEVKLILGDALDVLRGMPDGAVDCVVTDPPYGLSFMGKHWDHGVPGEAFWREMLRVAKPGAHLLAFGGTRTHHRLMVAIEDAGWEIRDCLMWIYGSGFPKSMDVSKALDKAAGVEREVIGYKPSHRPNRVGGRGQSMSAAYTDALDTAPATEAARRWDGWGTALKPAWEPIIMARKPLDGTIAQNVLQHGTGGINVDACRVAIEDGATMARNNKPGSNGWKNSSGGPNRAALNGEPIGRWPANVLLDEEAAAMLDGQSGELTARNGGKTGENPGYNGGWNNHLTDIYRDTGGASRFFYCAKASKRDRDEGLEGMKGRDKYGTAGQWNSHDCFSGKSGDEAWKAKHPNLPKANHHPTVKPTDLMRYLVRLVTPPDGVILDPFMGSGSTGKAAMLEGFGFVGIELEPEYLEIAERRIAQAQAQPPLIPHEAPPAPVQNGLLEGVL